MPSFERAIILVADGVGCGHAPDADAYGDLGADTLGNLARAVGGLTLPTLGALGLGRLTAVAGTAPAHRPRGAFGSMQEASAGKDTITGHWEMAGVLTKMAMATFPRGFPRSIVDALSRDTGHEFIGNKTASGTTIIEELGPEHLRTGALILYTSADSVLQIAAHEGKVPLPELHRVCEAARLIADRHNIGRVIARPFVGAPGAFARTYNRRDYARAAPEPTLCDRVADAGLPVIGVGKIGDIFAGRGITESLHSEGNADGLTLTRAALERATFGRGLLFVNLVDFDMVYGHRNDAPGFARALAAFDAWLGALPEVLRPGDVVFITADHGNDPTKEGTDHTRERVPLLAFGPAVRPAVDLGVRATFADLGQTVAAGLGVEAVPTGTSFLGELAPDARA